MCAPSLHYITLQINRKIIKELTRVKKSQLYYHLGFICTFLSLSSLKDVQDYNLQT